MNNFNVVFNCIFLGIYIYHVLYFLLQYAALKRIELFYYSLFLLSATVYYTVFVAAPLLQINIYPLVKNIFSAFQMSFAFIQTCLYAFFIIHYLELAKNNIRAYRFFRFLCYYDIFFTVFFLLLSIFHIESKNLFAILAFLTTPLLVTALYYMSRLFITYSNIVTLGTAFIIIGTIASLSIINYEVYTQRTVAIDANIPSEIGLLFDLFILGYGLSLKTAEVDKKLVKSLLANQKAVETERTRLARDLHDGLGGMLSGIKLTLGSISGNKVLTENHAVVFTKVLYQLDNTIAEMRRVVHSMIPEALLKFGLTEAVEDYCEGINESNSVKMKFTAIGLLQPLPQTTEIVLYRIFQELSNNAIKYAAAKNIFVQLNKHERGITLTVDDDGKGFETTTLANIRGDGLKNVQSRIDYLKGSWEIHSSAGKGTSVIIEIPLLHE